MANDKKKNVKNPKEQSKMKDFSTKTTSFFAGIRNELKKVVWPSKLTLKETTLAVLAISIGVAILVFVVDSLMMGLLNLAGFNNQHRGRNNPVPARTETVSTETVESTTDVSTSTLVSTSVEESTSPSEELSVSNSESTTESVESTSSAS